MVIDCSDGCFRWPFSTTRKQIVTSQPTKNSLRATSRRNNLCFFLRSSKKTNWCNLSDALFLFFVSSIFFFCILYKWYHTVFCSSLVWHFQDYSDVTHNLTFTITSSIGSCPALQILQLLSFYCSQILSIVQSLC